MPCTVLEHYSILLNHNKKICFMFHNVTVFFITFHHERFQPIKYYRRVPSTQNKIIFEESKRMIFYFSHTSQGERQNATHGQKSFYCIKISFNTYIFMSWSVFVRLQTPTRHFCLKHKSKIPTQRNMVVSWVFSGRLPLHHY